MCFSRVISVLFSSVYFPPSLSPEQRASTNKCDVSKDSCPVTNEENAECTDHSFVSCDSNDYEGAGSSKNTVTPKKKLKQEKKTQEKDVADPEPRLPFPCTSTLSSKEQMMYLESLKSKNPKDPPPVLTFCQYWCYNPDSPCRVCT